MNITGLGEEICRVIGEEAEEGDKRLPKQRPMVGYEDMILGYAAE